MTKEIQLLERIIEHDSKAFDELYDAYYPNISRFIKANSGQEEDAEDVFQEVLIILCRKVQTKDFSLSSKLSTYIYAIVRNLWTDNLRKKKRHIIVDSFNNDYPDCDNEIVEVLQENEWNKFFNRHFQKLTEDCKKIMELSFSGKSMNEVCKVMKHLNVAYTSRRKYKCKQKLIESIRKDPDFKEYQDGEKTILKTTK